MMQSVSALGAGATSWPIRAHKPCLRSPFAAGAMTLPVAIAPSSSSDRLGRRPRQNWTCIVQRRAARNAGQPKPGLQVQMSGCTNNCHVFAAGPAETSHQVPVALDCPNIGAELDASSATSAKHLGPIWATWSLNESTTHLLPCLFVLSFLKSPRQSA